jgi:fructosamine-3-kinase
MTTDFETMGGVKRRFPGVCCEPSIPDGAKVFVKLSHEDIFGPEVAGLNAMRNARAIRVAEVVGSGESENGTCVLVLEAIKSDVPNGDFFERFGRQLAKMHRSSTSDRFGFEHDNFLGASLQPNSWTESWTEFWAESRLGFQLKLARENGLGGSELQSLGDVMVSRLDSLIGGSTERPALIHGDLWSGNWICDERASPVLIDPAVYFANREAEFGMTTLFGGLPKTFYDAYNEAWPMADGWEDRVAIYRLYHLLNHLNLFGSSYLQQCIEILRRFS